MTKIETVAEEYVACVGVVEEEKLQWFESFGVGKYQFGVTMSRKNAWKVMSHLKNQSTKSAFLSIIFVTFPMWRDVRWNFFQGPAT